MEQILLDLAKTAGPSVTILIIFFLALKADMKEVKSDVKDLGKIQNATLLQVTKIEGDVRVVQATIDKVPKLEKDVDQAFDRLRQFERRDS